MMNIVRLQKIRLVISRKSVILITEDRIDGMLRCLKCR